MTLSQRALDSDADPIEAVSARREEVAVPLGPDDGVRRFNELYLAVTRAVAVEQAKRRLRRPRAAHAARPSGVPQGGRES